MKTTSSRNLLCATAAIAMLLAGACKLSSVNLGADTGGAATSGSSSSGGEGASVGSIDHCPTEQPSLDGSPCAVSRDLVCVWPHENGWAACSCGCQNAGRWTCFGASGGPLCPATQPTDGTACDGHEGTTCPFYPSTDCSCIASTHLWKCSEELSWPCLAPPADFGAPGIDTNKRVADLTDAERQTWCEWFDTSVYTESGQAPPPNRPVHADGTVSGYAFSYCGGEPSICMQRLSIDHCVANLGLNGCQALVSQLDDCAATIANACIAVGAGCDTYLAQTGCNRTIVTTTAIGGFDCSLPVH